MAGCWDAVRSLRLVCALHPLSGHVLFPLTLSLCLPCPPQKGIIPHGQAAAAKLLDECYGEGACLGDALGVAFGRCLGQLICVTPEAPTTCSPIWSTPDWLSTGCPKTMHGASVARTQCDELACGRPFVQI